MSIPCASHYPFRAGCVACREADRIHRRARREARLQVFRRRTPGEAAHAAEVVRYLKGLSLYEQARWCEQVLAAELPGIEVRPERRRQRRAA